MQLSRTLALICLVSLPASAQTLVRSVNGPAANALYGKACIRIADQNGDGFTDLLVGAPGFNSERGAIYCVSGAYIALGGGTQTLWSVASTGNQGDLFGYALAEISDATGDGVKDFAVGEPGYDIATANDVGAVRLVDGVTHALVARRYGFSQGALLGSAIDTFGANQVVIGAPGPLATNSRAYLVFAAHLATTGQISITWMFSANGSYELGASLAPGRDLDGDGSLEVIVGLPGISSSAGGVAVFLHGSPTSGVIYSSPFVGERLGASVDASHDYDGDGVIDIVVGAPNWIDASGHEGGRVVVLSGAKLVAQTPPYEIYTLTQGVSGLLNFDNHFGAAVCASGDLNNDGVGDIIVGAPDYTTAGVGGVKNWGLVSIYSGATGMRWATIAGSSTDLLGDSLTGAVQDFEGDGFKEFVVAGSLSNAGGTDSGVVKCFRLFPLPPATYCVGKVNSLGCTPAISWSGSPKVNSAMPFPITASNFVSQKSGILFYSHAPTSIAFQGGLKCVAQPSRRTPPQNSGGSASGADCTGTYSFDFNARIASHVDPSLVAGAEVFAQYWSRDPLSPSTTSLSNALRFVINP